MFPCNPILFHLQLQDLQNRRISTQKFYTNSFTLIWSPFWADFPYRVGCGCSTKSPMYFDVFWMSMDKRKIFTPICSESTSSSMPTSLSFWPSAVVSTDHKSCLSEGVKKDKKEPTTLSLLWYECIYSIYMYIYICIYIYMDVSENSGTPKSSGFNRVFHYFHHPFWDPYFWKHPYTYFSNKITLKGILSKPSFRWWKSSQGEVSTPEYLLTESTLEFRTSGKNMKPLLAPRAPLSNHITFRRLVTKTWKVSSLHRNEWNNYLLPLSSQGFGKPQAPSNHHSFFCMTIKSNC